MVAVFKHTSRHSLAERYRLYREYQMAFWEHVSEVILGEELSPQEACVLIGRVSVALTRIHPVTNYERRG